LRADQTLTPTPDDFASPEGFPIYQRQVGGPLQQVISDLLKSRFIDGPARKAKEAAQQKQQASAASGPEIMLKVMEARGLVVKEGKSRDAYCKVEFGDNPDDGSRSASNKKQDFNTETYMTDVVKNSTTPFWDQVLKVGSKSLQDRIVVSVWDQRKEDFLGQVVLSVGEVESVCRREGYWNRWYRLEPREGRHKDKYVGGEILLEMTIDFQKVCFTFSPFYYTISISIPARLK
jgi:hypothetical protein